MDKFKFYDIIRDRIKEEIGKNISQDYIEFLIKLQCEFNREKIKNREKGFLLNIGFFEFNPEKYVVRALYKRLEKEFEGNKKEFVKVFKEERKKIIDKMKTKGVNSKNFSIFLYEVKPNPSIDETI